MSGDFGDTDPAFFGGHSPKPSLRDSTKHPNNKLKAEPTSNPTSHGGDHLRSLEPVGRPAVPFFDSPNMGGLWPPQAADSMQSWSHPDRLPTRTLLFRVDWKTENSVSYQQRVGKSMRSRPVCTSLGWQIITSIPCFTLSTVMGSNFHESNEAHPDNCPIWLPLLNSTHHPEYRRL